ncbi:MAG: helix-turn-helix transcriptional regulator [Terriglobia bacterium]
MNHSADLTGPRTLGAFLRAHRERLLPTALGLPAASRRRTPGLRREEVAQLCGVSTTWYTWLEQGRPVSGSARALARIAGALQLSRAERQYLFEIAGSHDPERMDAIPTAVPEGLRNLVNRLPFPAYVLDRQWNAVAWNQAARELFRPWLENSDERNLLRFVFLDPAARELIVDWMDRARRVAAEFRSEAGLRLAEPPTLRLIEGLQQGSRHFAKWWSEHDVREREGGARMFRSARGKVLTYDQVALIPCGHSDLKLVTLVPQPTTKEKAGQKQVARR